MTRNTNTARTAAENTRTWIIQELGVLIADNGNRRHNVWALLNQHGQAVELSQQALAASRVVSEAKVRLSVMEQARTAADIARATADQKVAGVKRVTIDAHTAADTAQAELSELEVAYAEKATDPELTELEAAVAQAKATETDATEILVGAKRVEATLKGQAEADGATDQVVDAYFGAAEDVSRLDAELKVAKSASKAANDAVKAKLVELGVDAMSIQLNVLRKQVAELELAAQAALESEPARVQAVADAVLKAEQVLAEASQAYRGQMTVERAEAELEKLSAKRAGAERRFKAMRDAAKRGERVYPFDAERERAFRARKDAERAQKVADKVALREQEAAIAAAAAEEAA